MIKQRFDFDVRSKIEKIVFHVTHFTLSLFSGPLHGTKLDRTDWKGSGRRRGQLTEVAFNRLDIPFNIDVYGRSG